MDRLDHRIRSIQNDQQAIRHSSVIFVAPYWNYRISCLKVQLAPLAQDADSEKWLLIDCGPVSSVDIGGHIGYRECVEIEREMLPIDSQVYKSYK